MTKIILSLTLSLPMIGQTVTFSNQPGQVFVANFGAPLVAVSVYSAEVCSSPGVTASGSWGEVRQIAEGAGLNIVDSVLVPATAQRAQNKTPLHKTMIAIGIVGLSTLFVAATHTPPPWLIEGAATLAGGAQILSTYLAGSEAQVQATITAALGALADPTAQFSVSNGACVSSRLFLGQSVKNFIPIRAMLPSLAVTPSTERSIDPGSAVPFTPHRTMTHPAIEESQKIEMTVAGWDTTNKSEVAEVAEVAKVTWEAGINYVK